MINHARTDVCGKENLRPVDDLSFCHLGIPVRLKICSVLYRLDMLAMILLFVSLSANNCVSSPGVSREIFKGRKFPLQANMNFGSFSINAVTAHTSASSRSGDDVPALPV